MGMEKYEEREMLRENTYLLRAKGKRQLFHLSMIILQKKWLRKSLFRLSIMTWPCQRVLQGYWLDDYIFLAKHNFVQQDVQSFKPC